MTHTNKHTFTHTRKVTIRFHLFDKRKVIFQNKNKAARAALSARERERKTHAFAKFRTIDPFGPPSRNFSQIWQHCRRANKKVFKSNCFKCKQKQSNPLLSVSKATSHKHTHTQTNTHTQRNCKTRIE